RLVPQRLVETEWAFLARFDNQHGCFIPEAKSDQSINVAPLPSTAPQVALAISLVREFGQPPLHWLSVSINPYRPGRVGPSAAVLARVSVFFSSVALGCDLTFTPIMLLISGSISRSLPPLLPNTVAGEPVRFRPGK